MIQARSRRTWALLTAGLLTAARWALTAGGVASAQAKSLTVGSKDFAGAQAISQAYGQALENKGYDITFKDNLGATEIVYKALENGDLDGVRRLPGHAPHVPRRHADRRLGRELQGPRRRSSRAPTSWSSKPAPAVDVNGFYVTKATAKKYKLKKVSDLAKVVDRAHVRRPARVRGAAALPRYHVTAALRPRVQGGQEARHRRPDHGAGARGRRHRRRAALHRQQRDPEGRGAAHRRQGPAAGRQPGVRRSTRTRPPRATLKTLNAVSAKLTTAAYNKMSLDISEHKEDPADVGRRLPEAERLG